jgi:CMP-N,N'-diacetyllegionaminic acid synthase
MKNDIICFIPAKKRSSLNNKNMVLINKKPLLYYTLTSAKKSKYLKEIFVSSDSNEILNYSKKFNIKVLKRPKKLATNTAKGYEVISQFITKHDYFLKNKSLLILQPSSPLRNINHINKAINLHYKYNHKPIIGVKKVNNKFLKSFIHKQNKLYPLERGKYIQENRQNLPEMCIPNGAIFLFTVRDFKKINKIPYEQSIPMFMNEKESIDLDTKQDLIEIKKILKKNV